MLPRGYRGETSCCVYLERRSGMPFETSLTGQCQQLSRRLQSLSAERGRWRTFRSSKVRSQDKRTDDQLSPVRAGLAQTVLHNRRVRVQVSYFLENRTGKSSFSLVALPVRQ